VLDAVAAASVDLARSAAEQVADRGAVGEHVGVTAAGERLVDHRFTCAAPGYRGWVWTVTLARAPRAKVATVCEVELTAGTEAVLAPQWLPWEQRLRPGDVGPADVLPLVVDDPRLEQGFEATGEEDVDAVALWELGLGRPRVLSRLGRGEAADRWFEGDFGPGSPTAKAAAATCSGCGFLLPVPGGLRGAFGICSNEWSPADGRVVALTFGCGAHSETDVERVAEAPSQPILDELGVEPVLIG
jgi:hypothetical protein